MRGGRRKNVLTAFPPCSRCERGYTGARCEYLHLGWWKGEKRYIIIVCIIAGLVLVILLLLFICICSK